MAPRRGIRAERRVGNRSYRFMLERSWADEPRITFIMLNPSTADAARNDPTICRCMAFARGWGFGSLAVVNLFAFRAVRPSDLMQAADPVGRENDRCIVAAARAAHTVVVAWGCHGGFLNREAEVLRMLDGALLCLGETRSGHPRHPLYVPGTTALREWRSPESVTGNL